MSTGLPPSAAGGVTWILASASRWSTDAAFGGWGGLSFFLRAGTTFAGAREGGRAPVALAAATVKLTAWPFSRLPKTTYPLARNSAAEAVTVAPPDEAMV